MDITPAEDLAKRLSPHLLNEMTPHINKSMKESIRQELKVFGEALLNSVKETVLQYVPAIFVPRRQVSIPEHPAQHLQSDDLLPVQLESNDVDEICEEGTCAFCLRTTGLVSTGVKLLTYCSDCKQAAITRRSDYVWNTRLCGLRTVGEIHVCQASRPAGQQRKVQVRFNKQNKICISCKP